MLAFLTIVIMLAVAYAYLREGMFTACAMCINVFAAGLVAFNFWEPLADFLDPLLSENFLAGYEDSLCLVFLFCITLGLLRLATNNMAHKEIEYPPALLRGGAAAFGLVTGYLVAGFLVCVLQTLPWHQNFMGFQYEHSKDSPVPFARKYLPPDRVWLALMHRAGAYAFANYEDERVYDPQSPYERYLTFDRSSNFELRYGRYRRYDDAGNHKPYQGEAEAKVEQ